MDISVKPVVGYEGYYVSELGDVYSCKQGEFMRKLKTSSVHGYSVVSLCKEGREPVSRRVHRLVAESFLPIRNAPHVNHINGVRDDNRVSNLEWCTAKENSAHSRHVLGNQIGDKANNLKITSSCVSAIEKRYVAGEKLSIIANDYGVSTNAIKNRLRKNGTLIRTCWQERVIK